MPHKITRREMLRNTAAFAVPTILPSTVFGANAPSNRITVGVIGTGSKGTSGMRQFLLWQKSLPAKE